MRARVAAASGLRTPAVLDVVTVEGRPGIVFERVDAPTMVEVLIAHPNRCEELARAMAALHAALHDRAAGGLPSLRQRLEEKIGEAQGLSERGRAGALAALARLPDRIRTREEVDALVRIATAAA